MRRVIAVIALCLLTGTACYGAVSEDVYLRKDVFEVYMQNMNRNMERIIQKLDSLEGKVNDMSERMTGLSERIEGMNASLSGRIEGLNASLSGRIDGLDKRIDDLRNGIYLWLVGIGLVVAIIALPIVQDLLKRWMKSAPSITLEDVRRLIEENNAEIRKSFQV